MTDQERRIQACIDHINTAIDVDPWAKEMVAEWGKRELEQLNNSNQEVKNSNDLISRQEAESIFRSARMKLKPQNYSSAVEFHTRDLMLLNAEQFIHMLPSVQPERTEERTETHACDYACDCISRQDAIRWVKTECNPYGKPTLDFESGKWVIEHLKQMPSVQPEERTEERTETHACDCISRQAAIDAVFALNTDCVSWLDAVIDMLDALPSAQPYTDKEIQKIQDMEQAEIEKAFELGREDAMSEIIHCKDCKHKGTKNCVANAWTTIFGVTVKDDFYCGLAERRTDG